MFLFFLALSLSKEFWKSDGFLFSQTMLQVNFYAKRLPWKLICCLPNVLTNSCLSAFWFGCCARIGCTISQNTRFGCEQEELQGPRTEESLSELTVYARYLLLPFCQQVSLLWLKFKLLISLKPGCINGSCRQLRFPDFKCFHRSGCSPKMETNCALGFSAFSFYFALGQSQVAHFTSVSVIFSLHRILLSVSPPEHVVVVVLSVFFAPPGGGGKTGFYSQLV